MDEADPGVTLTATLLLAPRIGLRALGSVILKSSQGSTPVVEASSEKVSVSLHGL
jgi:hypothetical protein